MAILTDIIDPRVQQAVVAGVFVAVGWVFNGYQNRKRERRRRLERMQDVQTALIAEIDHYIVTLKQFDLSASWSRIVTAMEDDMSYIPVVPSERNDTIFSALIAEIHVLPEPVIQPVVGYYNQVFAVERPAWPDRQHGPAWTRSATSPMRQLPVPKFSLMRSISRARPCRKSRAARLSRVLPPHPHPKSRSGAR